MIKLRVFVSSVQKELAEERRAVKTLITSDPFLDEHCTPILYEDEPSMMRSAPQGYLEDLAKCQIYLVIVGFEYGKRVKGLSATHHEYHLAQKKEMPVLVCVQGDTKVQRDPATEDFLNEIRDDGHKYHRFAGLRELQKVVLDCLTKYIKANYHVAPTEKDAKASERTVATASWFDQQRVALLPEVNMPARVGWGDVDVGVARRLASSVADDHDATLDDREVQELLLRRGLLWLGQDDGKAYCSPSGILLFAKEPTRVYPHSCVRILRFSGDVRDPKPADFRDLNSPIPTALEEALAFIDKNTRHPLRVEGLRRLRLDEYPVNALREAIINALAHRDYEDVSRKVHIEVFSDRIEVISPGLLPGGVTLAQLRSGNVRPCSRNPVLAQGLRLLGLMEELGTGVVRMMKAMLDHGLEAPEYSFRDDCVVVTFRGPGDALEKIRTHDARAVFDVPPSVTESLTGNQKTILKELLQRGQCDVPQLAATLEVTGQAVRKDLAKLQKLALVEKRGQARATYYVLKESPSTP